MFSNSLMMLPENVVYSWEDVTIKMVGAFEQSSLLHEKKSPVIKHTVSVFTQQLVFWLFCPTRSCVDKVITGCVLCPQILW